MFKNLFKKKKEPEFIVVNLNARLQPMHRGEIYEDPLDEKLKQLGIGSVQGGGTLQSKTGEIENCDIEIEVESSAPEAIEKIENIIKELQVPKGSSLIIEATNSTIKIGEKEGMAIYLNGSDLEPTVYENTDINVVIEEITKLINGVGSIESHWEGSI